MTPFTEVLEHFARLLPEVGGVCINAESELEAVGMAWGALATGARAATGSTGQGLSLMQESFSEITLAELPLVIFNMARGQQDYFQATRGGGHGDYRHIVLAPQDVREGVEHVQLAFHLADKWRNPVLVYGDYLLAHTQEAVAIEPIGVPRAAAEGLGGRRLAHRQRRRAAASRRSAWPRPARPRMGQEGKAQYIATKIPLMEREVRVEHGLLRRRGDDRRRVRHRRRSSCKYAIRRAARRRAPHRLRAPDHAVAVPVRRASRDAAAGPNVNGSAASSSRPARWSTTCASASPAARRSRTSAASPPTAPASASAGSSTSRSSRIASSPCTKTASFRSSRATNKFTYQLQEHQK